MRLQSPRDSPPVLHRTGRSPQNSKTTQQTYFNHSPLPLQAKSTGLLRKSYALFYPTLLAQWARLPAAHASAVGHWAVATHASTQRLFPWARTIREKFLSRPRIPPSSNPTVKAWMPKSRCWRTSASGLAAPHLARPQPPLLPSPDSRLAQRPSPVSCLLTHRRGMDAEIPMSRRPNAVRESRQSGLAVVVSSAPENRPHREAGWEATGDEQPDRRHLACIRMPQQRTGLPQPPSPVPDAPTGKQNPESSAAHPHAQ